VTALSWVGAVLFCGAIAIAFLAVLRAAWKQATEFEGPDLSPDAQKALIKKLEAIAAKKRKEAL
jgi:hypothetical protein